jgi:hypothetical protein
LNCRQAGLDLPACKIQTVIRQNDFQIACHAFAETLFNAR